MKVNFKVKMKVTIEFLVEIYFRNDLDFFEKYFTWGNIQPSRDFLDTLYKEAMRLVNNVFQTLIYIKIFILNLLNTFILKFWLIFLFTPD